MLVLFGQGYILYQQTALTRDTAELSILQGLRQGIAELENSVYQDPSGRFTEAQMDQCASARPPFATAEQLVVKHMIDFYDLYYDAAKLLPKSAIPWTGVCEGAHAFINANCLVKIIWDRQFPKIAPSAFRKSFPKCTL